MAAARFELYVPAHGPGRRRRPAEAPVAWRLLTANNRDLGRSAAALPDAAACLAALGRLRATLPGPSVVVSSPDGRDRWTWRIVVDARDAAVSSRVYQRRVQAEAACGIFVRLAAGAPVSTTIRLAGTGPDVR